MNGYEFKAFQKIIKKLHNLHRKWYVPKHATNHGKTNKLSLNFIRIKRYISIYRNPDFVDPSLLFFIIFMDNFPVHKENVKLIEYDTNLIKVFFHPANTTYI